MATWADNIPTAHITQEQVDAKLQCSVCCEEFRLQEAASLLECAHVFHPPCIRPWLQLHTTCPVCRCDLAAQEDSQSLEEEDSSSDTDEELFDLSTQDTVFTVSLQCSGALQTEEVAVSSTDSDSDWGLFSLSSSSDSSMDDD